MLSWERQAITPRLTLATSEVCKLLQALISLKLSFITPRNSMVKSIFTACYFCLNSVGLGLGGVTPLNKNSTICRPIMTTKSYRTYECQCTFQHRLTFLQHTILSPSIGQQLLFSNTGKRPLREIQCHVVHPVYDSEEQVYL